MAPAAPAGVRASEMDKRTLPEGAVATLRTLPKHAALLVVAGGETTRGAFRLERECLTTGRHPDGDIVLDDPSVARQHAEFRRHGEAYRIRDLGSLHGTYVNHERVEDAMLTSRDQVRLGNMLLVFLTR